MNAYLATTDNDWFRFLSERNAVEPLDEVNFWMPRPWGGRFRVLERGQPLLFKVKSPHNAVAGGGFFEHYTELPISVAWDVFGQKNGAESLESVRQRIGRLRKETPRLWEDYTIGCIVLVEPFFWEPDLWIHDPPGWQRNIQRGRTYNLRTDADGRALWDGVATRLASRGAMPGRVAEPGSPIISGGYADPTLQRRRIGQGTFQAVITDLYERRCAVTQEKALPALEAAHIRPFSEQPEHYVRNGLLLRSDVHRLFDVGYITVTPEYRLEVSGHIHDDFNDGETYLKLHGTELWVPGDERSRPDPSVLEWHNENRFRG